MTSSQHFIPIKAIQDNLVFLKNGDICLVISTSAVNFGLLFETEQISIIESFAGLLNSLSFPIQIIIQSHRLDVSSYLGKLDTASMHQSNPLLKEMTGRFREYIEGIIKEKDVLDKKFYIAVSIGAIEQGIGFKNTTEQSKKAAALLAPRRDHLLRQLTRLGLSAKQLSSAELVVLFYTIFNPPENGVSIKAQPQPVVVSPAPPPPPPPIPKPIPVAFMTNLPPRSATPITPNVTANFAHPTSAPFFVEELPDE